MTTTESCPGNSSPRGVVNMMSFPAALAGATAEAVPVGRFPNKQGGLRLVVVGEHADELGLRMAERYGLVTTSMDELMKGRKGRKTDNVKVKAVSEWLSESCAANTGERHTVSYK